MKFSHLKLFYVFAVTLVSIAFFGLATSDAYGATKKKTTTKSVATKSTKPAATPAASATPTPAPTVAATPEVTAAPTPPPVESPTPPPPVEVAAPPTPEPLLPPIPTITVEPPVEEKKADVKDAKKTLPPNTFPSETFMLENGKISIEGKDVIVHIYKAKGKEITVDRKAILFPLDAGANSGTTDSTLLDEKKISYGVKNKSGSLTISAKGYSWKQKGGLEKSWKLVLDVYLPANEKKLEIEAPYIYVHELADIAEVELNSNELLDVTSLQNIQKLTVESSAKTVNLRSLKNVQQIEVEAKRSVVLGDIDTVGKIKITTEKGNIMANSLSGIKEATFDNELDVAVISATKIDRLNLISKRSSVSVENLSESRDIQLNARLNIDVKDAHLVGRLIAYSVDSEITIDSATLIEELELSAKGDVRVNHIEDVPNREFMSKMGMQLIRARSFK